jgi:dTDP-4-amino-4,6-dideoxygalactose transaminase
MIPHSRPTLGPEDQAAVAEAIASGWVAEGPRVARFEAAMAEQIGAAGAVAAASGTLALVLALRALEVELRDEVILPTYVCRNVWDAVVYVGATPILADVEPGGFQIDPDSARARLTRRTKAIIIPHVFGQVADLDELLALGPPMIEDCAHALGARSRGRPVGAHGTLAICSFRATKLLCTGEGGMVLANSRALADRLRDLRSPEASTARFAFPMTDLQAAMGLAQLERFPAFLARRAEIATRYRAVATEVGWGLPAEREGAEAVAYRLVVDPRLDLDEAIAAFARRGVTAARPVPQPLHRLFGGRAADFPGAEAASRTALSIPIYPSLTPGEVEAVCRACREVAALPQRV